MANLSAVTIERSDLLAPQSWMAFDAADNVVALGVMRDFQVVMEKTVGAARIVCGAEAYEAVLKATEKK